MHFSAILSNYNGIHLSYVYTDYSFSSLNCLDFFILLPFVVNDDEICIRERQRRRWRRTGHLHFLPRDAMLVWYTSVLLPRGVEAWTYDKLPSNGRCQGHVSDVIHFFKFWGPRHIFGTSKMHAVQLLCHVKM